MAIVLEVPPKIEKRWEEAAKKQGVSLSDYVFMRVMGIRPALIGSSSIEDIMARIPDHSPEEDEADLLEVMRVERAERRKLAQEKEP